MHSAHQLTQECYRVASTVTRAQYFVLLMQGNSNG